MGSFGSLSPYSMEEIQMEDDFNKLTKKELIEKLKSQSQGDMQVGSVQFSEHENQLENIDRLSSVNNPNQIPFTTSSDHKNVMLYTAINKKVGPLHPDNARRTMIRWKKAGIQLYTTPRTMEQIKAYKDTDEYKRIKAKHEATRKQRRAQSGKGKQEKMMTEIAKVTAEAVAKAK